MYPSVHSSTIYNGQEEKQPKCSYIDEWIKKMWCVYIYICIYAYSRIPNHKIWNIVFHIWSISPKNIK